MTRINCVPVQELCRMHLIAEARELPRIFTLVRKAQARGHTPLTISAPEQYVLGRGHVKFFYARLVWLLARLHLLHAEMVSRGYKPGFNTSQDYDQLIYDLHTHWFGGWQPTPEALALNRARIEERKATMKDTRK